MNWCIVAPTASIVAGGRMHIRSVRPAPDLADLVACFRGRISPGAGGKVLPLPARPELFVEFYFGSPVQARTPLGLASAPETVLVGPSTAYHTDLHFEGAIDTFTIKLQPTALHRLFGVPGASLVDRAEEAQTVERGFAGIRALLEGAPGFAARVAIAQRWLRQQAQTGRPARPIDHAARLIRRSAGQFDIDLLAARCDMAPRHFRRCFAAAVGVSPKLYSRIARFHAALEAKGCHPHLPWAAIAQRFGYFDQSHLLRDARAFAGGAMAGFSYPAA